MLHLTQLRRDEDTYHIELKENIEDPIGYAMAVVVTEEMDAMPEGERLAEVIKKAHEALSEELQ